MSRNVKLMLLCICFASLTSCRLYDNMMNDYNSYQYDETEYYYSGDVNAQSGNYDNRGQQRPKKQVRVPNSYHVGKYHSPEPHKSRDKTWVNSQNPMGYTIEVADDDKPSSVAARLHRAPKSDRKAQVKYRNNGRTQYKGLYGTYNNYQDAKKALDRLPPDVKQKARVKNWGNVQGKIND